MQFSRKARTFWPLLLILLLSDCTTKELAEASLRAPGVSHDVVGNAVRFTLVYNDRAAMGLLGPWAKQGLGVFSIAAAALVFGMYRAAPRGARMLAAGCAFLMAGALGNGWERVFSPRGVVDFIDVGIGAHRFWVFNVADIAVYAGALLLVVAMRRRPPATAGGLPLHGGLAP